MDFFDHKDLGNHLVQLCPKVVKHPVYMLIGGQCWTTYQLVSSILAPKAGSNVVILLLYWLLTAL